MGDRQVVLREFPDPQPGFGEVVLRTRASGLRGSELHSLYQPPRERREGTSTWGYIGGHEPAGVVEQVGEGVESLQVDDRVMVYHIQGCGYCKYCRAGWMLHCVNAKRSYGWDIHCGHADKILVKAASCVRIPDVLIYTPLLDDWMHTEGTQDVLWNGCALRDSLRHKWYDHSYLALSSTAHSRYQIDVTGTRALGSIAVNLSYVARGSALGAFIDQASIWDLAAGASILQRLGAEVRYKSGQPINWVELYDGRQISEPILAAHPALLNRLCEQIHDR